MLLEIAPVADGGHLPACSPSLMPFHISHTGPAPISRYLRPRPAPPSLAALSLQSSSTATLVASFSSTSVMSKPESSLSMASVGTLTQESKYAVEVVNQAAQAIAAQPVTDTATEMDLETQLASDNVLSSSKSPGAHTPERFVAAFRGRQMYGQTVDIPSGYGGLVLRTPLYSKGKGAMDTAKPKSKTRAATRKSKLAADERERGDGDFLDIDPPPPTRTLAPSSRFSSFLLWTPDRPLDEGRDEYARALVEWTRLANEVHSYDE